MNFGSNFVSPRPKPGSLRRITKNASDPGIQDKLKDLIDSHEPGDGELYRKIRELVQVSQEDLQHRTKISPEYVIAIENNAFHKLPSLVYVKGFLKSYLEYLGVSKSEPFIKAFAEKFKEWQDSQEL